MGVTKHPHNYSSHQKHQDFCNIRYEICFPKAQSGSCASQDMTVLGGFPDYPGRWQTRPLIQWRNLTSHCLGWPPTCYLSWARAWIRTQIETTVHISWWKFNKQGAVGKWISCPLRNQKSQALQNERKCLTFAGQFPFSLFWSSLPPWSRSDGWVPLSTLRC